MLSINDPYSNLKILKHLDRLKILKETGSCLPVTLNIYPTNKCNDKCCYCFFNDNTDIGGNKYTVLDRNMAISSETLIQLARDVPYYGIKAVNISGGGEPTLHPKFREFSEILLDNGIEVGLTTNGFKLYEYKDLIKRFTYLRVSVDSFENETRKNIGRSPMFSMEQFMETIAEITKSNCYTGLNFVINGYNYSEIYSFAYIAASTMDNVKYINYVVPRTTNKLYCFYGASIHKLIEKVKREFNGIDIRFSVFYFDLNNKQVKRFRHCWYNWLIMTITADCNVYGCCVPSMQGTMESFCEPGLNFMWHFDYIMNGTRRKYTINKFNPDTCKICYYSQKNELIEYLLNNNTLHENFI